MKQFLSTLLRNILACFKGRMIAWHLLAIVLTLVLVTSGFDWLYFTSTRDPILRSGMFPAALIGGLVPIALPLILLAIGNVSRSAKTTLAGWAVGQAELIGVSMTIHWFSDFTAGAIIGTVIGAVVGRSFSRSQT